MALCLSLTLGDGKVLRYGFRLGRDGFTGFSNDPTSTGKLVSSGCIRLINADVIDLHNLVGNHRGSTGDPAAAAAGPAFACRDAH